MHLYLTNDTSEHSEWMSVQREWICMWGYIKKNLKFLFRGQGHTMKYFFFIYLFIITNTFKGIFVGIASMFVCMYISFYVCWCEYIVESATSLSSSPYCVFHAGWLVGMSSGAELHVLGTFIYVLGCLELLEAFSHCSPCFVAMASFFFLLIIYHTLY